MRNASAVSAAPTAGATGVLLACGVAAGPIFVVVGLVEAFTRQGFDLGRHSLSLLANGDLGWIHVTMMVVTGLLTIAGAIGLRRALTNGGGRTWGPILVGVYGAGLVVAGLLTADPALGFPPGTPAGPPATYSWHGIGHLVAGGIGFLCLIVGCMVFARRFASQGERGWAAYSVATGVIFLAGFVGIASGNQVAWVNLAFGTAAVIAWAWISVVCARTRRSVDTVKQGRAR
jgi:hypothetical protein